MKRKRVLKGNECRLIYYRDKAVRWRWKLVAANNEIIGSSSQSFGAEYEASENFRLVRDADVVEMVTQK